MPLKSLLQAFASKAPQPALKRLRLGLIGAGRMGQIHARTLAKQRDIEVVGVVDFDLAKAKALAKDCHSTAFATPDELIGKIDAAIIATPTPSHFAVGKLFLSQHIACLIEKPLASNLDEATELVRLAQQQRTILQVGHVERFNPAVIEAAEHIDHPLFIEVNRLGPYDPRVAHIGVVMDLMIHDLDIVLFLVGKPVTRVEAFGAKVLSDHEDIAKVRLHFEGGCIADLSASRISLEKYRRIRIFQRDSYLSLDYAAPNLKIYKKKKDSVKSLMDISVLRPKLSKQQPIELEQRHFFDCVRDNVTPVVSGEHGRDALQLARTVLDQLVIHA